MSRKYWLVALAALVAASLACNVLTRRDRHPASTSGTGNEGAGGNGGYNTNWPVPDSVINFTDMDNGAVNFQTKMSLKDTVDFYRGAFEKQGLKERTKLSALTGTTFSMVFDGAPSGQAVVIQGVDLGNGLTNVNIR